MTSLAAPKVALKLTPVPKPVLYAGLAGELLKNTGMKDDGQIAAVQQAVSEQIVSSVIVVGKHADGRMERFTLAVKPFQPGESVMLQPEAGKSFAESLDVSLAAGIQAASDMFKRLGLVPNFYVAWSPRALANPAIIGDAMKRLNLKVLGEPPPPPVTLDSYRSDPLPYVPPLPPVSAVRYPQTVRPTTVLPPPPAGYEFKPMLTITPAKDPGVSLTYDSTRKV
jgi:hypothetical protein